MIVTFQIQSVVEVWHGSVGDLLQDDSEAVDVSFLSSVDRSSCHAQQFRRGPQLITVELVLILLAHVMQQYRATDIQLDLYGSYKNTGYPTRMPLHCPPAVNGYRYSRSPGCVRSARPCIRYYHFCH